MRFPSEFLPPDLARRLRGNLGLLGLGLLALALGEPMRAHSDALVTLAAPHGILSLQFACAAETAQGILATWDGTALNHARLSLLWDCGFAPAYGISLTALTERLTYRLSRHDRRWLPVLVWLPLYAAAADLMENLFHFRLLDGIPPDGLVLLPALACGFALFKWGALAFWLVALPGLGLQAMVKRKTRS